MWRLEVDQDTKETQLYENADYAAFWTGVQQIKLDQLERALVAKMVHLPARRIMDVGCGFGRLLDCYQAQSKEIVLLDSSKSLLQQAYQRSNGRAICMACDMYHVPFRDGAFDQIVMVRVFHHLPDSRAALLELNRLLVPGRNLLFSYCNKKNLERVLRWMIRKNPYNPFKIEPAWVWDRFFMHHPSDVRQMLQAVGFNAPREAGTGVVDKLAGLFGRWGQKFPLGLAVAPLFGKLELAPWIFCDTEKRGSQEEAPDLPLEELLQCPTCAGHLEHSPEGYRCMACGKLYPLKDGVYHFIED